MCCGRPLYICPLYAYPHAAALRICGEAPPSLSQCTVLGHCASLVRAGARARRVAQASRRYSGSPDVGTRVLPSLSGIRFMSRTKKLGPAPELCMPCPFCSDNLVDPAYHTTIRGHVTSRHAPATSCWCTASAASTQPSIQFLQHRTYFHRLPRPCEEKRAVHVDGYIREPNPTLWDNSHCPLFRFRRVSSHVRKRGSRYPIYGPWSRVSINPVQLCCRHTHLMI
jgi:hypothetical protein